MDDEERTFEMMLHLKIEFPKIMPVFYGHLMNLVRPISYQKRNATLITWKH